MKQFFTLISLFTLSFFTTALQAQITENFDNSLPSACGWQITNATYSNAKTINSTGDIAANSGTTTATIKTPFIDFYKASLTSVTNFTYKLSSKLSQNATRQIRVYLVGKNNVQSADLYNVTLTTNSSTAAVPVTLNINSQSTSRLVIMVVGAGDGNTYLLIDNLSIANASYHYTTSCNQAPTAANDTYSSAKVTSAVSGNVITNTSGKDADPNNETITVAANTQPSQGTLVIDANGNFTYTPAAGFLGGAVTFTYSVADNGYDALTSNNATVTINYPITIVALPVKLISFTGNLSNEKAQLNWLVAENETGNYFEIQKSTDGKDFAASSILFTTQITGSENYHFEEAIDLNTTTYYRLKIVNLDHSITYSKIIVIKSQAVVTVNDIRLLQNAGTYNVSFNYTSQTVGTYNVTIYSISGIKIAMSAVVCNKGINTISLNTNQAFNSGTYILQVSNGNTRSTTKFIRQ